MPQTLRIGILGSGPASTALANGFLRHGDEVIRGSRDPDKLAGWLDTAGPRGRVGRFETAARDADIVVLAVKGLAAEAALRLAEPANLFDKTVIDVTNPIADEPPQHGVLKTFTAPNDSLMERLQRMVPRAHFVKAFSSVGHELMVNPDFGDTRPTMFICGDQPAAKQQVAWILERFGWEPEDLGGAIAARVIEPLCPLWCLRGWARGRWDHAFKLLRVDRRRHAPAPAPPVTPAAAGALRPVEADGWTHEWQDDPFE